MIDHAEEVRTAVESILDDAADGACPRCDEIMAD